MSKKQIPFVKREAVLCPRADGYATALSSRYDGWGGYTTITASTLCCS